MAQAVVVTIVGFQAEAEGEAGAGGDAFGLARVFGGAADAVDAVLAFGFGVGTVVVALCLGVGGVKRAVPEGEAGVADLFLEVSSVFVFARVAADAEELQDVFDSFLLCAACVVVVVFTERVFLDAAAFPFEQAADFAFQAAAGDVGFAADGVFDNGVVDAGRFRGRGRR